MLETLLVRVSFYCYSSKKKMLLANKSMKKSGSVCAFIAVLVNIIYLLNYYYIKTHHFSSATFLLSG